MRIPTQERARKRVAQILGAAAHLVAHDGVEAVTTTGLAKTAKVPVGSVYQYFDDADDILRTVQTEQANEIVTACHAALAKAPDGLGWRETTRLSFDTYWAELLKRPVYVALLRAATRSQSFAESVSTGDSNLGDLFRAGLIKGGATLPADRAHVIVETALGSLSTLTDLAMLADDEDERDARRHEMLRMIELYLSDALGE